MRSTQVREGDITTRARIRDAAVDLIGAHGFARVTVRQVAAAAAVSPGLVIHHFGSKDGLRGACDVAVIGVLTSAVDELQASGPAGAFGQMARAAEYLPSVRYITRCLVEGGPAAQQLFDRIVEDTERWLLAAVADGTVRPSADEHARAKLLVSVSLGLQILIPYLTGSRDPARQQQDLLTTVGIPAVELYTYGLFTGTSYLDALHQEAQK